MSLKEEYIEVCTRKAAIEAAMRFDAHHGSVTSKQSPFLTRQEVAKMFGISVSKFDSDRSLKNKNREIHLNPIPNSGRKVLFHIEQVEAELERWKKRRRRS